MGKFVDLTGKYFNQWEVIGRDLSKQGRFIHWYVRCSCGNLSSVAGTNLTRNLSKSCGKCNKFICGVALNDLGDNPNYNVYLTWKRMIERCYSKDGSAKNNTYSDKSVCEGWLKASNFETWMLRQNWKGMELDKDLLKQSNKEYSPESCWFLPKRINSLLGTSGARRGEYPIGVSLHNDGVNAYIAKVGSKYLGIFSTTREAHRAWQIQKSKDIDEAVSWWQKDCSVNHTFNERIAENLFSLSGRLLEDAATFSETESLKI